MIHAFCKSFSSLFYFYRKAAALRHGHAALRRGSVRVLAFDDASLTWAFERKHEDERMIVMINRGALERRTDWPESARSLEIVLATGDADVLVEPAAGVVLPPLTGVVLKVADL
ncbi:MAG: hypothetical protein OXI38_11160 [Bacteroidota bacterium]|nr:hypothetical protein [Bacteroidota bacterium]